MTCCRSPLSIWVGSSRGNYFKFIGCPAMSVPVEYVYPCGSLTARDNLSIVLVHGQKLSTDLRSRLSDSRFGSGSGN